MKPTSKLVVLFILSLVGCLTVITLYRLSENIIHYHNQFIRRFPQHVAQQDHELDLRYNSYYFAGSANGTIYLGNYTAPLQVLVLDSTLTSKKVYQVDLQQQHLPFQGPQIRVYGKLFYVFEGIVPYIFVGSTSTWTASLRLHSGRYFSQLEPMDSASVAIRYLRPKTGESILGTQNLDDTTRVAYNSLLLQKQFDGIFDTDGTLLYNGQLHQLVYTYRYRNEFIVAEPNLHPAYRGNTIDTVRHAHVPLAPIKNGKMKTFASPPLVVNKISATYGDLLYINSLLPGQYESESIWKLGSIIDVYNLRDGAYRSSFPIYDVGGKKVRDVLVSGHLLYALVGNQLVRYTLRAHLSQNQSAKSLSQ